MECYNALHYLTMEITKLEWDNVNEAHMVARHGVSRDEVEEVCISEVVTIEVKKGRLLLVGKTRVGKFLSVVLAPKGEGIFYPVTARPASRKERAYYDEQRGGEQAA